MAHKQGLKESSEFSHLKKENNKSECKKIKKLFSLVEALLSLSTPSPLYSVLAECNHPGGLGGMSVKKELWLTADFTEDMNLVN